MFFVLPNGSEEWTSGQIPAKAVTMLTTSQRTSGTLYAAADRALLVSRDAGASWRTATAFTEAPLTALVAPRWESDAILAAAGPSIFISRDFGESWTERQFPERIRSLSALEPPWIAAITESEILVSKDGDVWEPYGRVARGDEIHGVVMSRPRFFVATTTGLRVSEQGRSLPLVRGLPEGNTVQAICRHPGPRLLLFAASYNSILASADGGRAWTRMAPDGWRPDSVKQLIVVPGSPDRLVVLTPQQGLFALPLDTEVDPHIHAGNQEAAK
jgi:hypothetical protein